MPGPSQALAVSSARWRVERSTTERLNRDISPDVCPSNRRFAQGLAEDSPFQKRELIARKDAVTLSTDVLALDQE
jgi:hypothetical protein